MVYTSGISAEWTFVSASMVPHCCTVPMNGDERYTIDYVELTTDSGRGVGVGLGVGRDLKY